MRPRKGCCRRRRCPFLAADIVKKSTKSLPLFPPFALLLLRPCEKRNYCNTFLTLRPGNVLHCNSGPALPSRTGGKPAAHWKDGFPGMARQGEDAFSLS